MVVANPFQPAKKEKIYLRMALVGTSGSGKTFTALTIASQLAALCNGKIAFIDTEGRSARKYADKFTFDVLDLSKNYSPTEYINAINAAVQHGYAVIVVDSFTHAWNGAGGVLDIVDKAGQKMGGNKFAGWATGRPAQNSLADTVLTAPIHILGTMRSKTEWLIQPDPKTGRDKPVKVGLAPVQSDDFEYEFDVVAYMDMQHNMSITKTRCSELDGLDNSQDTEFVSSTLYGWITDGEMPVPAARLAVNVLKTDDGKAALRALLKELAIVDNAPYLETLGHLNGYGEFNGTFDDLCRIIREIHEALTAPVTEPEPPPAVDPVAEAAAQISTEQAALTLGTPKGSSTRKTPEVADDYRLPTGGVSPFADTSNGAPAATGATSASPSNAAPDKNAIPADVLAKIDASIEDIPTTATNPNWKKRPAEQPAAGGD